MRHDATLPELMKEFEEFSKEEVTEERKQWETEEKYDLAKRIYVALIADGYALNEANERTEQAVNRFYLFEKFLIHKEKSRVSK